MHVRIYKRKDVVTETGEGFIGEVSFDGVKLKTGQKVRLKHSNKIVEIFEFAPYLMDNTTHSYPFFGIKEHPDTWFELKEIILDEIKIGLSDENFKI